MSIDVRFTAKIQRIINRWVLLNTVIGIPILSFILFYFDSDELFLIFLSGYVIFFWCLPFATYALINIYFGLACKRWPSTKGVIIRSKRGSEPNEPTHLAHKTHYANILYQYNIGDQRITSDMLSFQNFWRRLHINKILPSNVQQIVNEYPKNSDVTVFYNPNNFRVSVILLGIGIGNIIYLTLPLLFVGVFFYLLTDTDFSVCNFSICNLVDIWL